MSSNPRQRTADNWFRASVLLTLAASSSHLEAADTVELNFNWGPDLTILRDIQLVPPDPPVAPKALVQTAPAPRSGTPSRPSGGVTASLEKTTVTPMRLQNTGMRYRFAAKQQADGSYEIRVIDFLMRTSSADIPIAMTLPERQVIDAVAPSVRLDARGAFVALLDPDEAGAMLKSLPKSIEDQLKALPAEQQAEVKAQFEEMRSVGYLAARAAFPWFQTVGFWAGRRLEIGQTYTETAEERYMPISTARGVVRVERRWSAIGRVPCEEAPTAAATSSADSKATGAQASDGDCVKLTLRSTYAPLRAPVQALTDGRQDPRFESEIELVTEPSTLRPRRAIVTQRSRWRDAQGVDETKEAQGYRMRWVYGPEALVALKGTRPTIPNMNVPFPEPPNLKPKPEWPVGSPERTYEDYRTAVASGDWVTATGLMHPEFIARVAKRIRGREGEQTTDELRTALVGEGVTREQLSAMSDLGLVLLVMKRLADDQRQAGFSWDRPTFFGPDKLVLGHVEDREGRVHVVTQLADEYRMPLEYRGTTMTVALSLQDYPSTPGDGSSVAPATAAPCDPTLDVHRCLRIWRDLQSEYEPVSRVQSNLARRKRESPAAGAPPAPSPSPPPPTAPRAP